MPERSKTVQQTRFHLTQYTQHEVGHAVVGHMTGQLLSELSLQRNKDLVSRGYCSFASIDAMYNFTLFSASEQSE